MIRLIAPKPGERARVFDRMPYLLPVGLAHGAEVEIVSFHAGGYFVRTGDGRELRVPMQSVECREAVIDG